RRANAIAARLDQAGIQPGDFVGVCLERSPDLIAALIAILKNGAAYVPFEAAYPESRLRYLFQDSRVRVLVTTASLAKVAPPDAELVLVEDVPSEGKPAAARGMAGPESPAYLIYT